MLHDMLVALPQVFTLSNLLFAVAGLAIGLFVGAIPGIGGNTAIGLLIPFTYYLPPVAGIVALLAIGKGAGFGGSVPAILLNMPGTPQATMTAIDGYRLTRMGHPKKGLHAALYASVGGDLISGLTLLVAAPPLAMVALSVGPPEYSAIILFALMIIGSLVGRSPLKGLIAACFGLLFGTVGRDIFSGVPRLTFGIVNLDDGISLVPLLLGLLVFSEVLIQLRREFFHPTHMEKLQSVSSREPGLSRAELRRLIPTILRSGAIGTLIAAAPGLGATIGALLSYNTTKRLRARPSEAENMLRGVASAEAGNSSGVGANLIPLVTLGIPGNVEAALILGAFMLHGLTPGPFLMQQQGPLVYAIMFSLILASILLLTMGIGFLHIAKYILAVPLRILLPLVLVVTTIGAYSVAQSLFDVEEMFVFGLLGYAMRRLGFSPMPMAVAFLLGGLLENGIRRSLVISGGDPLIFVSSPISVVFVTLSALSLAVFLWRQYSDRRQSTNGLRSEEDS